MSSCCSHSHQYQRREKKRRGEATHLPRHTPSQLYLPFTLIPLPSSSGLDRLGEVEHDGGGEFVGGGTAAGEGGRFEDVDCEKEGNRAAVDMRARKDVGKEEKRGGRENR